MFFIMGIDQGRKDFDFHQMVICKACGAYGQYRVFMTYTVLSLFFIPLLKWSKRYYVQSSCCSSIFELDAEIGRRIAAGEQVEIMPEHLTKVQGRSARRCANCGYLAQEDFDFCPKCGNRF